MLPKVAWVTYTLILKENWPDEGPKSKPHQWCVGQM